MTQPVPETYDDHTIYPLRTHSLPPAQTQTVNDNDNVNAHVSDADLRVGAMKGASVFSLDGMMVRVLRPGPPMGSSSRGQRSSWVTCLF